MASEYARTEVVNVGPNSSAVGYTMYHVRGAGTNVVTGAHYDFGDRAAERLACGSLLPEAVRQAVENARLGGEIPAWIRAVVEAENETGLDEEKRAEKVALAAAGMWSEAERMELVKDGSRFRHRGQLARTQVLALPKEFTLEEQRELVLAWIEDRFTRHGLAVTWSIHAPDATSPENSHAHLTISTRVLLPGGFDRTKEAAKATGPKFYDGSLVARNVYEKEWRRLQEEFAAGRGIEIAFSDRGVSRLRIPRALMPGERRPGRKEIEPRGGAEIVEENARREAANERLKLEPGSIVERLTARKDLFTVREVERALRKEGVEGEEFDRLREAVLGEAVALADGRGEITGMYTSRQALEEARGALSLAEQIEGSRGRGHVLSKRRIERAIEEFNGAHSYDLDEEQRGAVGRACERRMSVWRGIAGGGKSSALEAVVEAHRKAGFRTVGTAFTNAVARDLGKRGMDEADTLHAVLYGLERGTKALDAKTLVIVDEAGQVSNELWTKLLVAVEGSGAKLLAVGDDRQLGALERGGLFQVMAERFGAAELTRVHRQDEDWMKRATEALAAGRFGEAVRAYREHGAITRTARMEDARTALVRAWMGDARKDEGAVRFVYAQVNAEVDRLNEAIREARKRDGKLPGPEWTFTTERRGEERTTTAGAGDRVQLYGNRKREGLLNGYCGTVLEAWPDQMKVRLDSGRIVTWDPGEYREWGLGYAGTVYRGQGKTQTECYYLHTALTESATGYVAWSRHTRRLRIFVASETTPDDETLGRQMGRRVERGSCLLYREATRALLALDEGLEEMVGRGASRRKVEELRTKAAGWLDARPETQGIGDWRELFDVMRQDGELGAALDRVAPRVEAEAAGPESEREWKEYEDQDRVARRVTTWFRETGERYDEAAGDRMREAWSEVIGEFGRQPREFVEKHLEGSTGVEIIRDLCERSSRAQEAVEGLPLEARLEVDAVLGRRHEELAREVADLMKRSGGGKWTNEERIGPRRRVVEAVRELWETGGLASLNRTMPEFGPRAERLGARAEVLGRMTGWLDERLAGVADEAGRRAWADLDQGMFAWLANLDDEVFGKLRTRPPEMLLQAGSERDERVGNALDRLPPLAPFDEFVADTESRYQGWAGQLREIGVSEPGRREAREKCLERFKRVVASLEAKAAAEQAERGKLGRLLLGASRETREALKHFRQMERAVFNDFGLGRGEIDKELSKLRGERQTRRKVLDVVERVAEACAKVRKTPRSRRIEAAASTLGRALSQARMRGLLTAGYQPVVDDAAQRLDTLNQQQALAAERESLAATQARTLENAPERETPSRNEPATDSRKSQERKPPDRSIDFSM